MRSNGSWWISGTLIKRLADGSSNPNAANSCATRLSRKNTSGVCPCVSTSSLPKRFLVITPWPALQQLPRYLKGVVMRLDKWRADPARDTARLAELRPLEQRWLRRVTELKGAGHARMDEYRWLLEELRVSLFAQELRTPQPVSAKRLDKVWAQLTG